MWIITKDGRPTFGRYATHEELLGEMHKRVGYSTYHAVKEEGYGYIEVPSDRWSGMEARALRAAAWQCLSKHSAHSDKLARDNCGACALVGRGAEGSGPNYEGWARIYVQAGVEIPAKWGDAFLRELHSDNASYSHALELDIATWGIQGPCRSRLVSV